MSDDLMDALYGHKAAKSTIMVVGVGGAGGNAVNHMWEQGIRGVEFMVCNTDQQALNKSPIENKIRLGKEGLGAGNDPDNGRNAAIESLDLVRQRLEMSGTRMLFVTAGMGGGTGTGASPIIAKLAMDMNILTVGIVTTPLALEGKTRWDQAMRGLKEIRANVDSLLILDNENIFKMYENQTLRQAFNKADDILASAARGIAEIIHTESDLVNIDFADVQKVMRNSGRAHMSVASSDGNDRAEEAARKSLESPLLANRDISGARNVLINISVSDTNALLGHEVTAILEYIQTNASGRADGDMYNSANIIWGTSEKPSLGSELEVVLVATGFDDSTSEAEQKDQQPTQQHDTNDITMPADRKPKRSSEPMMLGGKSSKYSNISTKTSKPAYQTRKMNIVVSADDTHRKVVINEQPASKDEDKGGSLF